MIPSTVVDLTPSASSVLASPPTDPAINVNLVVSANFSAALRIVAVVSVVPNRTGYQLTNENYIR